MKIFRILAALLAFFFTSLSLAETIPATPSGSSSGTLKFNVRYKAYSSLAAACAAENAAGNGYYGLFPVTDNASYPGAYCQASQNYPFWGWGNGMGQGMTCADDGQDWTNVPSGGCNVTYSCPSGYTLNGQSCTRPDCQSGFDRNSSGQCVKNCTGKTGQSLPSSSYEFANDGGITSVGGCAVQCNTWRQSGGGNSLLPLYMVGSGCNYTGTSATDDNQSAGTGFEPSPKKPTKPADCTGSGQGFVQSSTGTVTCVPSEQAPDGQGVKTTEFKKQTTATDNDKNGTPDPGSEKTTDTKVENDGAGTVKKTTTETMAGTPNDSGGVDCPSGYVVSGSNCVKTSVSTQDASSFCAQNPKDASCEGSSESNDCLKYPDRVSCMGLGTVTEGPALENHNLGPSSLSPVALAGGSSASCPADIPMPHGTAFSWEPFCMYASGLRPVILIAAWIAAALIVFGVFG